MSRNGDYDYGYEQTYYTPQVPKGKKSLGRRLSLGSKNKLTGSLPKAPVSPQKKKGVKKKKKVFTPPHSPMSTSVQSMTHVSMVGEVTTESDGNSPIQKTPETAGGIRRKLKIGGLRNTVHGSGGGVRNTNDEDDASVFSVKSLGRRSSSLGRRSFTPTSLKKKAAFGRSLLTKVKSERNVHDPRDYFDDSDNSQAPHFQGSKSVSGIETAHSRSSHSDVASKKSQKSPKKLKKKNKGKLDSFLGQEDDELVSVSSKSGRRGKDLGDDQSEVGTVVSKSGRRRKKKKSLSVQNSPGSIGGRRKLRSRSKGKRIGGGDDVSVKSSVSLGKKRRSVSRSKRLKKKVNAWGEEVDNISEDETYVHSLYGDDNASKSSKRTPRARRRKKKQASVQQEDDEFVSKESSEVEKRRLTLEQELESMLDLSNHKPDDFLVAVKDDPGDIPPPPPIQDSPLLPVRPKSASSIMSPQSQSARSSSSKGKVSIFSPKDMSSKGLVDDDDIQSQEDEDEHRPPIESLTFSQRKQRTFDTISVPKEETTEHTISQYTHRTYEYALGDTTTDEDDDEEEKVKAIEQSARSQHSAPSYSRFKRRGSGESVSSRISASSRASKSSKSRYQRFLKNGVMSDEVSDEDDSSRKEVPKVFKKDLDNKMDSMLDQLEKYESNLEDGQKKLRKQLENITIEKEYLAQRNRQLEVQITELKDKAAEDADRLLMANRNRNQSSEELEDLKIQNEILKEKLQRHEESMLRMNSAKSVRGMRTIIKNQVGEDPDPEKMGKELKEKDKEITKLKADLALLRDQLRYKSEDFDKQAVELEAARKEVIEARDTLKHTGTFKYHNKFEEIQQEKTKNKSQQEVALSSFFDD